MNYIIKSTKYTKNGNQLIAWYKCIIWDVKWIETQLALNWSEISFFKLNCQEFYLSIYSKDWIAPYLTFCAAMLINMKTILTEGIKQGDQK